MQFLYRQGEQAFFYLFVREANHTVQYSEAMKGTSAMHHSFFEIALQLQLAGRLTSNIFRTT